MSINPTYVTLEQAKVLKDKGFNVPVNNFYTIGIMSDGLITDTCNYQDINYEFTNLSIWSKPEQWQVIEWLRIEHGIHIRLTTYAFGYQYHLDNTPDPKTWTTDRRYDCETNFETPQEAYSAAFDYILNELI